MSEASSSSSRRYGLGPLMDGAALSSIALQLLSARHRLSLRTGGVLPTVGELAVGLRMYIRHCDAQRAADRVPLVLDEGPVSSTSSLPSSPSVPSPLGDHTKRLEMRELLRLASLTYASRAELLSHGAEAPKFRVLSARWQAEKWAPAYFLAYFHDTRVLLLSVRGSKEMSDFITNLSCETEPFLEGYGHRGVVQSARGLHRALAPVLDAHVATHDVSRFLIVGHSLGGAVGTALALMFRSAGEALDMQGNDVLHCVRCVAFGPPPFLSRSLAEKSVAMGVTTIVTGLDLVPRLSAASLDRLLVAISRHDWSPQVGDTIERAASMFVSAENAARVSSFLAQRGGAGASWAVSALGESARRALEAHRLSAQRNMLWEGVLTAGLFTSNIVSNQFLRGQDFTGGAMSRQPEYSFARQFGMSGDDVEQMLVEDSPPEMFLAGEILHFDIPFLSPERFSQGEGIPISTVRRKSMDAFRDVEASAWMMHDHNPKILFCQLDNMLRSIDE